MRKNKQLVIRVDNVLFEKLGEHARRLEESDPEGDGSLSAAARDLMRWALRNTGPGPKL